METKNICNEYLQAALNAERFRCHKIIDDALVSGMTILEVYEKVFYPVMVHVGELWQHNEINVAQEHLVTAITQNIISTIYPTLLKYSKNSVNGNAIVVCPGNELHELGARMLSDLWEMEGWDVSYLGANLPVEYIADTLNNGDYQILALSCTISFNLKYVKETIEKVRSNTNFDGDIVVGGRVFNIDTSLKDYVVADYHVADLYSAIDFISAYHCK